MLNLPKEPDDLDRLCDIVMYLSLPCAFVIGALLLLAAGAP